MLRSIAQSRTWIYNETRDPTSTDDLEHGFIVGNGWFRTDTEEFFLCKDNTNGAAIWIEAGGKGGGGVVESRDPTVSDDETLGFDIGETWFNSTNGLFWVCLDSTKDAAVWVNVSASIAKLDRNWIALNTASPALSKASASTVSTRPFGAIRVFVNGHEVYVGDGDSERLTSACFFSNDPAGATARAADGVQAGDSLWWNGTVAGYDLTTNDRISLIYEV